MSCLRKKICVMVNILKDRECGAENDAKNLMRLFSKVLKFDEAFNRQYITANELYETVEKLLNIQSAKPEVFVLFISSHGCLDRNGTQLKLSDDFHSVNEIVKKVSSHPSLLDVPKLFFVNCCRSSRRKKYAQRETKLRFDESQKLIISFSTKPGYKSYRNENGSSFISLLCKIVEKKHSSMSLQDMLQKVSINLNKKYGEKQTSEFFGLKKPYFFH